MADDEVDGAGDGVDVARWLGVAGAVMAVALRRPSVEGDMEVES